MRDLLDEVGQPEPGTGLLVTQIEILQDRKARVEARTDNVEEHAYGYHASRILQRVVYLLPGVHSAPTVHHWHDGFGIDDLLGQNDRITPDGFLPGQDDEELLDTGIILRGMKTHPRGNEVPANLAVQASITSDVTTRFGPTAAADRWLA